MSTNTTSPRPTDNQDLLSSQSSDEKMDTGSESFLSMQDTPNSVLSSDFEDKDQSTNDTDEAVLRLQNPRTNETSVLRLSEPVNDSLVTKRLNNIALNDSLVTKMSNLSLNSLEVEDNILNRPRNLCISPPKFSTPLTLATNHPLMGISSPDSVENFPDVVPKKVVKKLDEEPRDLSLSSIEDERVTNEGNSFTDFDGPQRNTSKNNLYFHENFSTADSQVLNDISRIDGVISPPDVARIEKPDPRRRKIPCYDLQVNSSDTETPQRVLGRIVDSHRDDSALVKYVEERNKKLSMERESTPIKTELSAAVSMPEKEVFLSGTAEWCESPSQLRSMPNFQLPIEMSSNIALQNQQDLESPDVLSASTQEDLSLYRAQLDPRTGSVVLRHTSSNPGNTSDTRRKIAVPDRDDASLDSISNCSLGSEEDEPLPEPEPELVPERGDRPSEPEHAAGDASVYDDATRNSVTESDPISEYSAAEEFEEERAWLKVPLATGGHRTCDKKVIEPYCRVLSHGGYLRCGCAIIVVSACHLPDSARPDYHYVMDNLFLYVIWSLERLVSDTYVLVYLHGSAGRRRLPTWRWLHQWYKLIDRRLRKSLQQLYLVHPTFWLKTMVVLSKPFISSKFFRKLSYKKNLAELMEAVPVDPNAIPDIVKQFDEEHHR